MVMLDVIVKEPLYRRLSFDDYWLCYENFNKKSGYGDTIQNVNAFGYKASGANNGVFTQSAAKIQKKTNYYEDDFSSDSNYSNSAYEINQQNTKLANQNAGTHVDNQGQKPYGNYFGSINIAYK